MNAVIENILTRRSIRAFNEQEIARTDLEEILQAAIYAPSGMNRQTWQFTAITNRNKIQVLAQLIAKILGREGYNFYNPAVIVLASNEKESRWGREDNACALQNMFLAAHSLDIGSVWINQLQGICDEPEIRSYLQEVGVPSNHTIYGIAALGYPVNKVKQGSIKSGKIKIIE